MSERLTTLSGVTWSLMSQAIKMALQFASTIILARLLTPHDFGVFAMLLPIIALAGLLQEFGLSQAVLQRQGLTSEQVNKLFWINLLIAGVICASLLAFSPLLAAFFNEPDLAPLIAAWAGITLIASFGFGQFALLSRAMRFKALACIEVVAAIAAFVVTMIAAYLKPSPWALWIGALVNILTWTALALFVGDWRPSRPTRGAKVSSMYQFGLYIMLDNFAHLVRTNLDTVLIGRYLGSTPLGLYDRAYKLLLYPLENIGGPIGRVMLPVLSRLQNDPEGLRKSYLRATGLLCAIIMPGVTVTIATSDVIIGFLLGPKWLEVSTIFFWLGVGGLTAPYLLGTSWLMIAEGRARELMNVNLTTTAVAALGFILGLPYGVTGVALAFAATECLFRTPITILVAGRRGPVRRTDHVHLLMPNFLACGVVFATVRFVLEPQLHGLVLVGVSICVAWVETVATMLAFPRGRELLRFLLVLFGDMCRASGLQRVFSRAV